MKIEPRMIQWFDDHWYKIEVLEEEPQYLPSVTTILGVSPKPFLARWRGDIGNREADNRLWEASEKGTRIHVACYTYCDDGVVIYNPFGYPNFSDEQILEFKRQHNEKVIILHNQDEMWQIWKFQKFLEVAGPVVCEKEMIVYSIEKEFAGTLDYVMGFIEGDYQISGKKPLSLETGKYVVDLKSGNVIDEAYHYQTAAYQYAYEKMTGEKAKGRLIVHTNAKTKTGIEGLNVIYRGNDTYEEDLDTFWHLQAIWRRTSARHPKIFEFPTLLRKELPDGEDDYPEKD